MSPDDVRERLAEIENVAYDDEAAHSLEDDLYRQLLEAIADGLCQEPELCARLALKSQNLHFERWGA